MFRFKIRFRLKLKITTRIRFSFRFRTWIKIRIKFTGIGAGSRSRKFYEPDLQTFRAKELFLKMKKFRFLLIIGRSQSKFDQETPWLPFNTKVKPIVAPTALCVVETGAFSQVAKINQAPAPNIEQNSPSINSALE